MELKFNKRSIRLILVGNNPNSLLTRLGLPNKLRLVVCVSACQLLLCVLLCCVLVLLVLRIGALWVFVVR